LPKSLRKSQQSSGRYARPFKKKPFSQTRVGHRKKPFERWGKPLPAWPPKEAANKEDAGGGRYQKIRTRTRTNGEKKKNGTTQRNNGKTIFLWVKKLQLKSRFVK